MVSGNDYCCMAWGRVLSWNFWCRCDKERFEHFHYRCCSKFCARYQLKLTQYLCLPMSYITISIWWYSSCFLLTIGSLKDFLLYECIMPHSSWAWITSFCFLSAIITAATLDIVLSLRAWRSLKCNQIFRYLLKFAVAAFWVVVMPVAYSRSVENPTGLVRFFSNLGGSWLYQSLYNYCVAIYLIPNILAAVLFLVPYLRRTLERSNSYVIILLMWWAQVRTHSSFCF